MPIVITAVLFVLWMAIAWRQYERGEMMLAGLCVVVGVLLSLYRLKLLQARQKSKDNEKSPLS